MLVPSVTPLGEELLDAGSETDLGRAARRVLLSDVLLLANYNVR